ncbi:MAG TPA: glycosyltransferase family 4 protein [Bryobacteraceae bacterium]|nr:glycosyltransferase family 4 protein [Bryobacteraceae bacterium]
MRILYLQATYTPPPKDPHVDRFFLLSEFLEGDVLQPVWARTPEDIERSYGSGSYPAYVSGRFRYHWMLAWKYTGVRRRLAVFWFCLRQGLALHRQNRYDCIIAYSHMTNGLIAAILKLLTGAKLIIEIATAPERIYISSNPRPTLGDRLRKFYSDVCLHISLWSADRAHLLHMGQVSSYRFLRKVRASVFHDFVPVSAVAAHRDAGDLFVLFVGAPWYLKGADRLIQAFRRLAPDFPEVQLKLLGHYPDRAGLDALCESSPQIEILKALTHPQTLELISQSAILVLPSRCEGLPRVIIEAMTAGVPVIGSDVGGIPSLIRDGENGFVVPNGDPVGLEARMRELLGNAALRERLGARGRELVLGQLNEQVYVREFAKMVALTVEPDGQAHFN